MLFNMFPLPDTHIGKVKQKKTLEPIRLHIKDTNESNFALSPHPKKKVEETNRLCRYKFHT